MFKRRKQIFNYIEKRRKQIFQILGRGRGEVPTLRDEGGLNLKNLVFEAINYLNKYLSLKNCFYSSDAGAA